VPKIKEIHLNKKKKGKQANVQREVSFNEPALGFGTS
jgi:hypothetical protein